MDKEMFLTVLYFSVIFLAVGIFLGMALRGCI